MRVKYVLSEVLVGLWRNVTMTIAMIITMAVSLTMLGASGLMYRQVDDMKEHSTTRTSRSRSSSTTDVTEEQRIDLQGQARGRPAGQGACIYVDKEQAYERFQEHVRRTPRTW